MRQTREVGHRRLGGGAECGVDLRRQALGRRRVRGEQRPRPRQRGGRRLVAGEQRGHHLVAQRAVVEPGARLGVAGA